MFILRTLNFSFEQLNRLGGSIAYIGYAVWIRRVSEFCLMDDIVAEYVLYWSFSLHILFYVKIQFQLFT